MNSVPDTSIIQWADRRRGDGRMADWKRLTRLIARGRRFVVVSHIYPDGDAVGSSLAMLRLLRAMGKRAVAFLPSPVPPVYRFLDRRGDLRAYRKNDEPRLAGADAVMILDSSTDDRLDALYEAIKRIRVPRVCIDHHPGNSVTAELKLVDTGACSTCQMIYELYHACTQGIDKATAEALYTGIHTDTVSFNFLGTTARTHEIAADLLRRGVDAKQTWTHIYGNDSPRLMKLAGVTLAGLQTADRGRIAWITVTRRQWRRMGVSPRDTESFTRYPLTIRGVGVIILFCEEGPRQVRVSLRALDRTDVGRIARSFGGGGHQTSAGVTLMEPLARAVAIVLRALRRGR